jgi:hypothetical protein
MMVMDNSVLLYWTMDPNYHSALTRRIAEFYEETVW